MVASLLKVISTGIQDERLFYKMTFYPFLKMWKKAGRFTTQWIRFDFDSVPTFGGTSFFRITRKGHICTRLYLVANMPRIDVPQIAARAAAGADFAGPNFGWTNSLGHALVAGATMDIGGARVENLNSRLLEMLDEYSVPLEKTTVVNRMIKRVDNGFTDMTFGHGVEPERVIVPLPFWFCRGDPGCGLPVDAISHDEMRIGITFRGVNGLYYTDKRNVGNVGTADGTGLWPMSESRFYKYDIGGEVVPGIDCINPVVSIPGIQMPREFRLGETYIMAEFVYLDQPEANRFRLADLQIPIVQHYAIEPFQTQGLPRARIRVDIPNPTRDLYWFAQRVEAPSLNAHFLATRELSAPNQPEEVSCQQALWWPDAIGLDARYPGPIRPAFALSNSEPMKAMALMYEGSLVRFRTENPAIYRSILPSFEQKKSPWINRYYYNLPIGIQNGIVPFSKPRGEGNLDKVQNRELVLEFEPLRGSYNPNDVPSYVVYVFAETYNVLRVYGGRAGTLFAY
jgi:hypothetical protein